MKKKWNSAEDFVSLLFCRQIAYTLYYLFHVGLYTYLQWFSHPKYELFSPAPQLDLAGCGNNPFPKRTACGLHWAKARQIHMWCLGLLACELEMVSKTGVPCWRTTECPRRHLGFFVFLCLPPSQVAYVSSFCAFTVSGPSGRPSSYVGSKKRMWRPWNPWRGRSRWFPSCPAWWSSPGVPSAFCNPPHPSISLLMWLLLGTRSSGQRKEW